MRKQSREIVFKLLFAKLFGQNQLVQDEDLDNLLAVILDEMELSVNEIDIDYIHNTYLSIIANYDELCEKAYAKINKYAKKRIYNADLVILVLAIYELKQNQLDPKIIISEAVKLAKKYSTDNSIKFVNGVLSVIAKE